MRLAAVNQFYWPDNAATARLLTDLCEHLAARGHDVHVVCGGGRWPVSEQRHGVSIHRVPSASLGRTALWQRGVDAVSFHAAALRALLRVPRPDVILAMSSPPLVATPAQAAAAYHRSRLCFWVQDVYPDVAVALHTVRAHAPVTRAAAAAAALAARGADVVVVLGPCMRQVLLRHGAAPERVHVVDNWADGDAIRPRPARGHPLRDAWHLGDALCVMYAGHFGLAHEFDTLRGCLEHLRHDGGMEFVMVGDGPRRAEAVRALAGQRARFPPTCPLEQLGALLTAADVHLVSLHGALRGLVVPSKIYGVMAAGRPILFIGPRASDAWQLVEDQGAGLCVENGDARGLAHALARLRDDVELQLSLGRRAREVFDARFRRPQALARMEALLTSR